MAGVATMPEIGRAAPDGIADVVDADQIVLKNVGSHPVVKL